MKLKLKIFKKYFLLTVTVIILSLTFMLAILSFFINNYLAQEKHASLKECCNSISELTAARQMSEDNFITIMGYVSPIVTKTIDAEILVTDTSGNPLYCSCNIYIEYGSCEHTNAVISSRMIKSTLNNDELYEVGDFDGKLKDMYYIYGTKLKDNSGSDYAVVYAFSPTSTIRFFYLNILKMFLISSIATVIIMFFAVYYVSYRLTKPLTLMSEAARCMAKGDFSRRIPVTSDDEVGELALSFNIMTDSLVKLESTRRSFVANVSHELKTPMTTIGGFIDGIIDETIPDERRNEYLKIVSDEVKRLSRLVQSMLSLSKLESGEMRINMSEFDISSTLINIVVAQQQRIEARNISIIGLDTLGTSIVKGDCDLIHQVIYNLVDNAVKFTATGGEIIFKTYTNDKNHVHFVIRNTGAGIDSKDLPHIFERFYKTDKSRSAIKESTGLGLYIVKTIIDIHHGKITVKSKENEFTEFDFYLPKNM